MQYKHSPSEPIAIVGSACRFAGGVSNTSQLWQLLSNPKDLTREVPADRFNARAFYHSNGEYHGTTNSIKGYFLDSNVHDTHVFDAQFFNITPREAEAIDPQQRMALEIVYESLESAGYTLQSYAGKKVAVYAGVMTADYDALSQRDELFDCQYYATGNARSILSNRISYFFDWHGASMTIDTACSSSLVALHQAVTALRAGEAEAACVAGTNLMLTPEQFITEASLHMLSPTGQCKMWDKDANGYARGEGITALFLKTVSQALRDGDTIQAIVRETGVNSDGRTRGITMPNPKAQSALIIETYKKSGLDPKLAEDRCQYFEAHGTGTQAGDPNEASAIHEAFFGTTLAADMPGGEEPIQNPLIVGSVKTVIGHTEGAAGLAGVLKTVQAMQHRQVPPNLHFNQLNPSVRPYYSTRLKIIADKPQAWPKTPAGHPLRASVNSFGFGGTNAHCILESYEENLHGKAADSDTDGTDDGDNSVFTDPMTDDSRRSSSDSALGQEHPRYSARMPLVLSANSQASLRRFAEDLQGMVSKGPVDIARVAWACYNHRTTFPFRVAVPSGDIIGGLQKLLQQPQFGTRVRSLDAPVAILGVFTGQGAQWAGMASGLIESSSIFANTLASLEKVLAECAVPPPWSMTKELCATGSASRIADPELAQPLSTAVQIGVIDMLKSLGIRFRAVVGHSSGEIGAAYAAGRLSAREAMLVAYYRGVVANLAAGRDGKMKGAMIATGMSRAEATALCARPEYVGRLSVAASNSSTSVTISGDEDAADQLKAFLESQKTFVVKLRVGAAYHSHHMLRPGEEYLKLLAKIKCDPKPAGETLWVSSVPGYCEAGRAPSPAELNGKYWAENMMQSVMFHEALTKVVTNEAMSFDCAIEVGPHPQLQSVAEQTMHDLGKPLPYSGVLNRKKADADAFADFLSFMWLNFGPQSIDLRRFVQASMGEAGARIIRRGRVILPSYPWDHTIKHHRESRVARQYHFRSAPVHELLGVRTRDDTPQQPRWRNYLHINRIPWVEHHKFQGMALLPASAYCVMALDAARFIAEDRKIKTVDLRKLQFNTGIPLERDAHGVEILFSLDIKPQSRNNTIEASFTIESGPGSGEQPLKRNFSGNMTIVLGTPESDVLPRRPTAFPETLSSHIDTFYDAMNDIGLLYTGPFRAQETIDRRFNFATTTVKRFHSTDTTSLAVSPATLDACFQTVFSAFSSPGDRAIWTSFLPIKIDRISFNIAEVIARPHKAADKLIVDAQITHMVQASVFSQAQIDADMMIHNESGAMEIQVSGLKVGSFALQTPDQDYELYLHSKFEVDPEDEVVQALDVPADMSDALIEAALRVTEFYLRGNAMNVTFASLKEAVNSAGRLKLQNHHDKQNSQEPIWPGDNDETIDAFISSSPWYPALGFIRDLGQDLPDILPGMLPTILTEATQLGRFQGQLQHAIHQIAHRYPRMNVLAITDPEHGFAGPIIKALHRSFVSLRIAGEAESNIEQLLPSSPLLQKRISIQRMNLDDELPDEEKNVYDLTILSTTALEKPEHIQQVRAAMRPGAFLLLCHTGRSPLKDRIRRFAHSRQPSFSSAPSSIKAPYWPDILDSCGFVAAGRKKTTINTVTGFTLSVRQVECQAKAVLSKPMELGGTRAVDKLVIVGGKSEKTMALRRQLETLLSEHVRSLKAVDSIEFIELGSLEKQNPPAILLLEDLDVPLMTSMTTPSLDIFRALFKPGRVILWLTHNARYNPDYAASLGFTRSISAEVPSMSLQVLDVDTLDCAPEVTDVFLRLALRPIVPIDDVSKFLWSTEREVYLEKGKRYVARVVPFEEGNDRVNCVRRIVSYNFHTLERNIRLVTTGSGEMMHVEAHVAPPLSLSAINEKTVRIAVEYSTARPIRLGDDEEAVVLCAGREVLTGREVIAPTSVNSSFIDAPFSSVIPIENNTISPARWLDAFSKALVCRRVLDLAGNTGGIVLLEPDEVFLTALKLARHSGASNAAPLLAYTTSPFKPESTMISVHEHASAHDIRHAFPARKGYIIDFLPKDHNLSGLFNYNKPNGWSYMSVDKLTCDELPFLADNSKIAHVPYWDTGLALAKNLCANYISPTTRAPDLVSVPVITSPNTIPRPFQLVDWRAERNVSCSVSNVVESNLFRPDRTYVFLGLTRDFGQSLCTLFASHGARNLVIASRNPKTNLQWVEDLAADGITVKVEKLDICDLKAVRAFKTRLSTELRLPPVGGIINGAMVLDDRVFAQMDIETWDRVLRPKVVGSSNLDVVFDGPELEFFIMTSSFAATGGHGGQSNYAVANMYMNGIAAKRRARGLPGSAINIGVIYGLGLLHRDQRTGVYDSLEREGYPPISERDIHHMILESVVSGRPNKTVFPDVKTGHGLDLTCGLGRYDPREVRLHWHRDPRFGHFVQLDVGGKSADDSLDGTDGRPLLDVLRESKGEQDKAVDALFNSFRKHMHRLLHVPEESLTKDHSVAELGVDSLAAVEIRAWIWTHLQVDVPVMKILGAPSIDKLCRDMVEDVFKTCTEQEAEEVVEEVVSGAG